MSIYAMMSNAARKTEMEKRVQRQWEIAARQRQGESTREIDTTEHSAQHMFLLRPLLLQGLFDLSEFFFSRGSHSPQPVTRRRLSLSLSPSKPERERGRRGKSTRKLLLTWRDGPGCFQIRSIFFFYKG